MNALRKAALDYADRGWRVLPLVPGRKIPLVGKRDGGRGWLDATSDRATVERWWRAAPEANVGLACRTSGLLVLDVDPRHGGDDSLHQLERDRGAFPDAPRVLTGGGGLHVYLAHPECELRGILAPGIDLKDAGYVLAPPSKTERRYEWEVAPDEASPPPVPAAWLARMSAPAPAPRTAPPGGGDDYLLTIPPPRYFEVLTGVAVNPAGGKITCPLPDHRDRSPSCHVYAHADAGWCCYGCRRGGGIYQLGAHLARLPVPLRGVDFLRVQAAIFAAFEAHVGVSA